MLEVRDEDVGKKGMTFRVSEDRISIVFLDTLWVLEVIAVKKAFCTEVWNVVELRDNAMPVVGACESVSLEDLGGEMSENEDGGLIRSVEERADQKFKVLCFFLVSEVTVSWEEFWSARKCVRRVV